MYFEWGKTSHRHLRSFVIPGGRANLSPSDYIGEPGNLFYYLFAGEMEAVFQAPLYRRTIRLAFVPPKPKELDNAVAICARRALFGT